MNDVETYLKAVKRVETVCGKSLGHDDIIIFLEKEIDTYRDKIKHMEERAKIDNDFFESIAEAVQELVNKYDALAGRVEQLGDLVENKMDHVLGEYGQTLTSFIEERTSDGGTMTLSRKTATWKLVAECLLTNGYFVCCHFDDEDETITIEYFRA